MQQNCTVKIEKAVSTEEDEHELCERSKQKTQLSHQEEAINRNW